MQEDLEQPLPRGKKQTDTLSLKTKQTLACMKTRMGCSVRYKLKHHVCGPWEADVLPLLLLKKLLRELGKSGWLPCCSAKDSSDTIIWLGHIHASLSTSDSSWEYAQ